MSRVAVIGAGATVAPAVLRELRRRGHEVVALGRDPARLEATRAAVVAPDGDRRPTTAGGEAPPPAFAVVPAVTPGGPLPAELVAACRDAEVVVHVGRAPSAPDAARAALETGRPLLDAAGVHPQHRVLLHDLDEPAREAGVALVTGVGAAHLTGDLLAELAVEAVPEARELHVAAVVPSPGGVRAAVGPGGRAALLDVLAAPSQVWRDGEVVLEAVGEARRMAWFPRPVGPHHAVGVGGLEPLLVPVRHPQLATVRTYLAVPGWQAELVQLAATLARRPRGHRWLAGRLERRRAPGPAVRAASRWAVVAEAATGPGDAGEVTDVPEVRRVARAWANGHDPLGLTAAGLGVVLDRVVARGAPPGVGSPATVGPAPELLDELSAASDLRWGVVRPE